MKCTTFSIRILIIIFALTLIYSYKNSKGAGVIYCFANTDVWRVIPNLSCNDARQPPSTKVDYRPSTSNLDPSTNPCLSTQTPFDGSISGQCGQLIPGTNHFKSTAE